MPRASRLRRAAVDICNRFCATRSCGTACSGHDKPPDGMPTGTDRTHSAGRPTARCDSKRQELARDVPAGQFVEREGDPPGDQLLKDDLHPLPLRRDKGSPFSAPTASSRRIEMMRRDISPFVFCAKFQRKYDIIHIESFPPKERQMVKKSKEETLGEDRLICVLITE